MSTQLETAENNARAVVLSEELDFLDQLLDLGTLDPTELRLTMDRRDVVRDSLVTVRTADPNDDADEGMTQPPSGTTEDAYDDEDELEVLDEDDDHEYSSNRNDKACTVCGEPRAEHEEAEV